jgi:hypothetical protein
MARSHENGDPGKKMFLQDAESHLLPSLCKPWVRASYSANLSQQSRRRDLVTDLNLYSFIRTKPTERLVYKRNRLQPSNAGCPSGPNFPLSAKSPSRNSLTRSSPEPCASNRLSPDRGIDPQGGADRAVYLTVERSLFKASSSDSSAFSRVIRFK